MGKRRSFQVLGEVFPTKTALQQRIRAILYGYRDGENLCASDLGFMLDVLRRHPDYEQKAGAGISHIFVKRNPTYTNTRCFWIGRIDGSQTDFSYNECLDETPHAKRFVNACRVAIAPVVQEFKRRAFLAARGPLLCPYTGERLDFSNSHVDHQAPATFQALVESFVSESSLDISAVTINGKAQDNTYQDTFDDKELEQRWIEYHNANASLQLVSRLANLSILKRSMP